jgi:hypothetical protein
MTRSGFAASHQVEVKVAPPDDQDNALPVASGRVDYEGADATTRARCSLTVDDPEYVPSDPEDILAPFGQELQVWRGARGEELHSLGVFLIQDVDSDDDGDGGVSITLNGLDRSQRVIDAKFESAGSIGSGTNYVTEMASVLQEGFPQVTMADWPSTGDLLPRIIYQEGEDRWVFLQNLAAALGYEIFFDRDGDCRLEAIPDPLAIGDHVHLHEGRDGILLRVNKAWSREDAVNKVLVTGENASESPASGVAVDQDLSSPTRWDGPFGRVPHFESFEYLTSDDQCETAAQGILNQKRGIGQRIGFGAIVDPTVDVGDAVHVHRERLGLDEVHILDTLGVPLSATEEMSGTTRIARIT